MSKPIKCTPDGCNVPVYYCPRCGSVVKSRVDLTYKCYDCMWESD